MMNRAAVLVGLTLVPMPAWAKGEAIVAGEMFVEHPTLENLGFEWDVQGDSNRNANVEVAYRAKGETHWKTGLPLLRLNGEDVHSRMFAPAFTYVAPNMFAGSVFDLKPGTTYEVRLTLVDSDGVKGSATRTRTVVTRSEPTPAKGGRTYHVYPFGYAGPKQSPAFDGLLAAYYQGAVGGDWYNAFEPRVRPGDIILVHAGEYKDRRFRYAHELVTAKGPSLDAAGQPVMTECCTTTGDGTYYLTAKGTADRPIVIKAAGDGEVVFDGDGNYNLFNVQAGDHTYFEGITFRNTDIAIEAGIKKIAGASGIVVKRSKFEDVGVGIHSDFAGSQDFYIADNEFTGRHNPRTLMGWKAKWTTELGFPDDSRMLSQYAVKLFGPGHVIAYNRIRNFHDGIDHATYGGSSLPRNLRPSSIDIYNNDISNMHDNCIEADGAMQNIRIMRNLCANVGANGFSMEPLLGGPAYFIRNILYNNPFGGSIRFGEYPAGGLFYNNSWFTGFAPGEKLSGSNMHLRNNLFLRQNGAEPVLQMPTFTNYSSSDHNGLFAGSGAAPFQWSAPASGVVADYREPAEPKAFSSFADYRAATGQDAHSIEIDFTSFRNVKPVDPKSPITTLYDARQWDFGLVASSPAVDAGAELPNITDGFAGKAPDLGAIESGQAAPHVGPRPLIAP